MKKTVIIAILLAYVASILAVQFFGLKVVEIAGNTYVTELEVKGFEFVNRGEETEYKYRRCFPLQNDDSSNIVSFWGYYIDGNYDLTEESLATNPNRIKILYEVIPYNATLKELSYYFIASDYEGAIYFDEKTKEIVFLERGVDFYFQLETQDGSMKRMEVSVYLR